MTGLEVTLTACAAGVWLTGAVFMAAWLHKAGARVDSGFWAVVALWPPVIAGAAGLGALATVLRRFKVKPNRRR